MTNDHDRQQQGDTDKPWSPPDEQALRKAITAARTYRRKKITRTIILKLHKPGRRKSRALIWAQVQMTNMTAHILEELRETPGDVRSDKAFAFIQEAYSRKAQGAKGNRTRILGDILEFCFTAKQLKRLQAQPDGSASAEISAKKSDIRKWVPPTVTPIKAAAYPVTAHLRTGMYREVARTLLAWFSRVIATDEDAEDADDSSGDTELTTDAARGHREDAEQVVDAADTPVQPDAQRIHAPALPEVFDIAEVHRRWAERRQPYEAAAQTIVPFGWYRGKTLEQVGKREVRWLRERLIPEEVAQTTLDHIEVLLNLPKYTDMPERLRQARQARHPWRRQTGFQRKTRVSRAFQRSLDVPEPRVRLKTLNEEELLALQSELQELREFAVQFETMRKAVDTFLSPAPARYPTVHALLNKAEWNEKYTKYDEHLDMLRDQVFEADQEAADQTANEFQSVASDLARPDLQPLAFKRPMRPGVATFALLYAVSRPDEDDLKRKYQRMGVDRRQKKIAQVLAEGDLYTYVLAVVIHGEEAFPKDTTGQQMHEPPMEAAEADDGDAGFNQMRSNDEMVIGIQPPERFTPNVKPGLWYVNYPHTPFVAPRGASVLLFPVECGERYHENEFLRHIIERQRKRQEDGFMARQEEARMQQEEQAQERHANESSDQAVHQSEKKKLPPSKEAFFPRNAPLGSARITSERTRHGYYNFYVHLPVIDETPRLVRKLRTVLGFHEHAYGYSYARLNVTGHVLEVGDVMIPPHALPKEGDTAYSDNYVYETVKAMIALGRPGNAREAPPDAIIGLENASWKKQSVSLSREQNRVQFSRPSRKIATVLGYKAPQVGLPRPLDSMVSLNQCSACSKKRDPSIRNMYPKTARCPTCSSTKLQETAPGSGELKCQQCERIWQEYEPWFVCPTCGYNQIARLNTAIVVAQHTLTGFVRYYQAAAENSTTKRTRSE